jgi:hypothetical protein
VLGVLVLIIGYPFSFMHFFSLGRDDRPSLSISWSHPLTNPPSGELKEKKKGEKRNENCTNNVVVVRIG